MSLDGLVIEDFRCVARAELELDRAFDADDVTVAAVDGRAEIILRAVREGRGVEDIEAEDRGVLEQHVRDILVEGADRDEAGGIEGGEIVEHRGVADGGVFDRFREAFAEFAVGKSAQGFRVDDDEARLMEGS